MTKISVILIRASPIMETLTGIMIEFNFAGHLIFNDELEVNNFFSFLANDGIPACKIFSRFEYVD